MYRGNLTSFMIGHRNDIGDVVFTLRIIVGEFCQPALHVCTVSHQNTGIDFLNLTLLVGGIFMLNDASNHAVFTRNTPVAGWVIQFHR
ncbi:hypothetical protein D3C73_1192690 [compost metagenome]